MSRSGKKAELFAERYLQKRGFEIIDRNWSNRFAEIDIIARKNNKVHFLEVKYRKSASFGVASEYLTDKKIKQVRFAARLWLQEYQWEGESQIDGIAITGALNENNTKLFLNI